jgi:hypothetical protein
VWLYGRHLPIGVASDPDHEGFATPSGRSPFENLLDRTSPKVA